MEDEEVCRVLLELVTACGRDIVDEEKDVELELVEVLVVEGATGTTELLLALVEDESCVVDELESGWTVANVELSNLLTIAF